MPDKIRIIGISGSLRKQSYNTQMLHEAEQLLPENAEMEIFNIGSLPLFNDDLSSTPPDSVVNFKNAIRNSDAIIFASPEYNYSISGVLKNAIDWGSRPVVENVFDSKPGAILGVSNGKISTGRSQYELRKICFALNMEIINRPEIMIGPAADFFDQENHLINEKTKEYLSLMLQKLVEAKSQI